MHKTNSWLGIYFFLTIFAFPVFGQEGNLYSVTTEKYKAFANAPETQKGEALYAYCEAVSAQLSQNDVAYGDLNTAEAIFFISYIHGTPEYLEFKQVSPGLAAETERDVSSFLADHSRLVDYSAIYPIYLIPEDRRRQLEVDWNLPTGSLEGIPLQPDFSFLPPGKPENEKKLLYQATVKTNEFFEKYDPRNIRQLLNNPLILWMIKCTDIESESEVRTLQDLEGFIGETDTEKSPLVIPAEFNRFIDVQLNINVFERLEDDATDFFTIFTHIRWLENLSRKYGINLASLFDEKTVSEIKTLCNDNLFSIQTKMMQKLLETDGNRQAAALLRSICHTIAYLGPRIYGLRYGVFLDG